MTTPATTTTDTTATPPPPGAGAAATPPVVDGKPTGSPAKTGEGSKATTEGDKGSGGTPNADAGKKPPDADADLSISLPEGVVADAAFLDSFKATAKELGLKSEQAQKLADTYVGALQRAQEQQAKAQADEQAKWTKEIQSQPEFAGEKFALAKAEAQRVAAKYGGEEFAKLLSETALGDHPAVFRFCAAVAKADAEDRVGANPAVTSKPTDSEKAKHDRMFPSMK